MKPLKIHPALLYFLKHIHIVLVPAVVLAGAVAVSILGFVERDYSSQMKVLVVQKYTLTDSYTAAKSAEKVAQNLATVVQTSTFLTQVVEGSQVDLSLLILMNEEDKREEWAKKVEVSVNRGQSIMELNAYDPDPVKAQQLIQAVVNTLLDNGASYHGAPDTIELRVVDTALTSKRPVRPSVMAYSTAAGVLGAVAGALFLFFQMDVSMLVGRSAVAYKPTVEQTKNGVSAAAPTQSEPQEPTASPYAVLDVTNYHKHRAKK